VISNFILRYFNLAPQRQVRRVPVAAATQRHDVVCFNQSHHIVVALHPVVAARVHPADVVAAVSRATLVSHEANQLVRASVQALSMGSVESSVFLPDLVDLDLDFGRLASEFRLFFLGLFRSHFDVGVLVGQSLVVFLFSLLTLKFAAQLKRLAKLVGAKFKHVEGARVGDRSEDLCLAAFSAADT